MHSTKLFTAAVQLLQAGAVIDEVTEAPCTYRICYAGDSAPLPGFVFAQLRTHGKVRLACKISGRPRYVGTS
ncbi:MAG: hypothetical protein ACP5GF_11335 [Thiomonas sp.]